MPESYHVHLAKEQFTFSAAHFITFGNNICERLHGHNYRVAVDFHGSLVEHDFVIDFIALRDLLISISQGLDHHVLLPTKHPKIRVACENREVIATFEDRRWVFPKEDCILLPVTNTTAEKLAWHIGKYLLEALEVKGLPKPTKLVVAVDECDGQQGVWTSPSDRSE